MPGTGTGSVCVCWDQNESVCVCVYRRMTVPVHLQQMMCVSAQRFGLGQEQKEGHCAPWQCVRVIQISFHF